jgi:hypothetical protein
MTDPALHGTVHEATGDFVAALRSMPEAFDRWRTLTPLGRNEFLCWIADAKQEATRTRRIGRAIDELMEGKRRPCCWAGCVHRDDKAPGPWQRAVLVEGKRRRQ